MPKSSVLAVDLGGTKIAVASVDSRGSLRKRRAEPVDNSSASAPIDQIVRLAKQFDGVANLISLFDPEMIVLSGGLTGAADLFLEDLRRIARECAQPLSAPKVEITVSSLGSDANLLGAARLAFSELERSSS